jgi:hypothetical protein
MQPESIPLNLKAADHERGRVIRRIQPLDACCNDLTVEVQFDDEFDAEECRRAMQAYFHDVVLVLSSYIRKSFRAAAAAIPWQIDLWWCTPCLSKTLREYWCSFAYMRPNAALLLVHWLSC